MEKLRQKVTRMGAALAQASRHFARRICQPWVIVTLVVLLLAGAVWLVLPFSGVGIASGIEGLPLSIDDLSAIPQSVADDAAELARGLFGNCQEKCDDFVKQVLALYAEAKDSDFVVLFNSGGWGWNLVENSPSWWSIITGIKSELDSTGYKSLFLNYQRTAATLRSNLDELWEMITGYPSKARDLAARMEFLTSHIPNLNVIITGESIGAIICDRVMNLLRDNPQVYCIQTGPPFWHTSAMLDRTLVVIDNGTIPDSFSRGDFLTMIRANLRALFGLSQPEEGPGKILYYVRAPGHDYNWQYSKVCSEITDFLAKYFGIVTSP